MLVPGIKADISPTDFYPLEQMQLQRFRGREMGTSSGRCPAARSAVDAFSRCAVPRRLDRS